MQNVYPTVGELIDNKTIPLNSWVWVDETPVDNTNAVFTAAFPLSERSKALVVTPAHYERLEILHTDKVGNPWIALRFKEIDSPDGKNIVLDRRVSILHISSNIEPSKNVLDDLHVDNLEQGAHYFTVENDKSVKMLSPDEVTFKKKYYKVIIKNNKSSRRVEYEQVDSIVAAYTIYEYYPSGKAKLKVHISIFSGRKGIEIPAYAVTERTFVDKDMPSKPRDEKHTKITDPNHHYWVQNILHD